MRIDEPGTLKAFLNRHHLAVNKGLGQHFLSSRTVVSKIIDAANGCQSVIEIGPGPGILTGPLCDAIPRVVVIELDDRMPALLAESAPQAEIISGDALQISLKDILSGMESPVGIVSNMPYYITAPLLQRIADVAPLIDRAVLMMQREVANRIVAKAGNRDRGSLSVYLQALFEIEAVAQVPAGAFLPPPKVDSSVLLFTPRGECFDSGLFDFIRTGFSQPRKTLANNLAYLDRTRVQSAIDALELSATVRPHEVTFAQWQGLHVKLTARQSN